jgi:hypothetical protein
MVMVILLITILVIAILVVKGLKSKQALEDSEQMLRDLDIHENIVDNINKAKEKAEEIQNKSTNQGNK